MSGAAPLPFPAKARNRSIEARRAARVEKAVRERRIVDLLNHGVSVAEIAAREGVTEKRMRAVVREILAGRMPKGGADYAALQLGRLNEALLVAMSAMSGTNIRAVECVVRIVRAMDRYAGFVPAGRRAVPEVAAMETEAQAPLTLPETAPRGLEKAEVSPGAGRATRAGLSVVEAPPGERPASWETVQEEGAPPAIGRLRSELVSAAGRGPGADTPQNDCPRMALETSEIIESAPGSDLRPGSPADGDAGTAPGSGPCGEAPPQGAPGPKPANLAYVAPDPYEFAPVITVSKERSAVGATRQAAGFEGTPCRSLI